MTPKITVIVATRNRPQDIPPLLTALEQTQIGGAIHEVLLVDDASTVPLDRSPLRSDAFSVHVLRNARRLGASGSRNAGAARANGDVLAFLDDDARPLPGWCRALLSGLTPERAAITGRVLPLDGGVVSRARQYRYEQRYAVHRPLEPVRFFAGGNSAVWTALFHRAGGFPGTGTGSDNGLVAALDEHGGAVHFAPDLRVAHRNSKGMRTAVQESWRSGRTATDAPTTLRRELRRMAAAVRHQPWRTDIAAAGTNSVLQAIHSAARSRKPAK
uniref:Glycosyl transferase family 2 n=1 Tax=Streptomyces sp. FR1 TaxID=349971 RepID=V9YZA8_9ACTN|nr:glycosyltransferase family 2 protein [Streptomyces sp. FR1]AHE38680.1 Glycosyl transferase family 2 [Streptomyces sp. FR1]